MIKDEIKYDNVKWNMIWRDWTEWSFQMLAVIIIIIIFYFENVTFFHAKLRSGICPRVDNQPSGDTLQDLTRPLSGKIAISQLSTHG